MTTTMQMYDPPHPGEFITETYLTPFGISGRLLATHLGVSASTLARVLNGSSRVTPEMALRLGRVIGRSPESWLAMQDAYDLWEARPKVDVSTLAPVKFAVS
jgi:addiction module HigA family antidote